MGIVAPSIFLCVASFLMNMVLARLISTQREQIAALKAFGFTRWEIARHFLAMAWVIAGFGTIVGLGVGMLLGQYLTQLYSRFFHFPSFVFSIPVMSSSQPNDQRYGRHLGCLDQHSTGYEASASRGDAPGTSTAISKELDRVGNVHLLTWSFVANGASPSGEKTAPSYPLGLRNLAGGGCLDPR